MDCGCGLARLEIGCTRLGGWLMWSTAGVGRGGVGIGRGVGRSEVGLGSGSGRVPERRRQAGNRERGYGVVGVGGGRREGLRRRGGRREGGGFFPDTK